MSLEKKCLTCGNEYDKAFTIELAGLKYTFDSFECAIEKLAPKCSQCRIKIIGHGMESDNQMFCCAHCAKSKGEHGLNDRMDHDIAS